MAITREQRVKYLARNGRTGLTNVTAIIRRNGVAVLGTDTTPLPLVEIGNGQYELVLSAAQLNSAGGAGWFDFYINSATRNAPGIKGFYITEANEDDLAAKQIVIEGKIDAIASDVTTIASNVTSIKTTVEDTNTEVKSPTHGLSEIKNVVDALQNAIGQIQNNTRFTTTMPVEMVIKSAGVSTYRVWAALFDTAGNLEDPDGAITVSLQNDQGAVRNDYLKNSVAGAPVDMTPDSTGIFYIDLEIPDTASEEQLITFFDYVENTIPLKQVKTSNLVQEVNASGLALEATSQSIKTTVETMGPQVADIQTKINDASIGLAAIKNAITGVQTTVDANNTLLSDGTVGLAALKAALDLKASQTSVDDLNTLLTNDVKGTGFDQTEDSLAAISDRTFFGGGLA
jgi:predicted  nucleic acid-binding Zn-ribbon protein